MVIALFSFSALRDRVFREDLLDPLEGLLGSRLRRHPAGHDIDPARTPGVLVLNLGIGRVEGPKLRRGRAEQALLGVSRPVRVREPPRVAFDDRRHRRDAAAEPRLSRPVTTFGLIKYLRKFFG